MPMDESRRKFLGGAGAAVLAAGLRGGAETAHASQRRRSARGAQALRPFGFVIHGGAGTIERSRMTPEREAAYRAALTEALTAGFEVLRRDGPGLERPPVHDRGVELVRPLGREDGAFAGVEERRVFEQADGRDHGVEAGAAAPEHFVARR